MYVISDEQIRVSEGMVRCGTCRERFQARILKNDADTPRFDPREAFIEPLTEERSEQQQAAAKILADTDPQEFSFADPHTESEKSISLSDATVDASINSDLSLDIDDDAPITPVNSNQLSAEEMLANIRAKHARQAEQAAKTSSPMPVEEEQASIRADIIPIKTNQQKLVLPTRNEERPIEAGNHKAASADIAMTSVPTSSNSYTATRPEAEDKETLIDEVDSLINNKLINISSAVIASADTQNSKINLETPFNLDRKPKVRSRAWLLAPLLLIVVALLGVALVYQLWMKQIVAFKNDSFTQKKIAELSIPLAKELAKYDVTLPVRRNLSQLELASAHTEAHPTRASTTLLRISIINHAEIEQPLPWLEMSLTDTDGRLVSRRNLSPGDYVYQNATNDLIGARELKKVTIELLSFPKQATGYELKILNK